MFSENLVAGAVTADDEVFRRGVGGGVRVVYGMRLGGMLPGRV